MSVARQVRLPEVGAAGQARIAAAHVAPGVDGFARTIATTYLARAGVSRIDDDGIRHDAADAVRALGIRHAAAREVAEGAMAALVAVRAVLVERT